MTVPVLPDPPSSTDPANFRARGDAFFDAMYAFSVAANELGTQLDASVDTVTGGLAASMWVSGSNYSVGDRRFSPATGLLYRCTATATGRTTDPSADTSYWHLMSLAAPSLVTETGATATVALNTHVEMSNAAACTATLASASGTTQWAIVGFQNGRADNQIAATGGQKINGQAGPLVVDWPNAVVWLRWTGATYGWRVIT